MKKLGILLAGLFLLVSADTLLIETFDTNWTPANPPAGWIIIRDSLNPHPPQYLDDWHREPANAAPWINHPTPYAAIMWQLNPNQTPDIIISPVINCSAFRNIVLYCSTYFSHKMSNPYTAQIRYSIDGGATFPYVLRDYYGQNVGPGILESLNLSSAARQESVRIAWVFQGNLFDINWWFFDDVVVTGESILPYDIRCARIIRPDYYELPGNLIPQARFRNIGLYDQFNIPVFAELFDSLGNTLYMWADTIDTLLALSGEKVAFFDSTTFPLTTGRYTIRFWHAADSDYNRTNDTLQRTFIVSPLEELVHDNGAPAGYLSWPVGHYGWCTQFITATPVYLESLKLYLRAPVNPAFRRYQLAVALDDGSGNPGPFIYKTPVLYAQPGAGWNSVFVADTGEQITVAGSFYIFYLQVGEPPEAPELGIDNSLNYPNSYWEYYADGTRYPVAPAGDLMLRVFVNHDPVTPVQTDARVTFIEQPLYEFIQRPYNAVCPLRAHVQNFGLDTLYNVAATCSIIDATNGSVYYNYTANIAMLTPGQTIAVDFPNWVPYYGVPCSIIVRANTSSSIQPDLQPQNDDKRYGFDVIKGAYTGRHIAGYAWIDSDTLTGPVYDWIDTTGFNILFTSGDDERIFVPIGFNFPWSDTTYDNCYVTTNGWLSLGPDPHTALPTPTRIPNESLPNALIAPWWQDLVVSGAGRVYYRTFGTEPNRKFVVIWQDVNIKGTDTTNTITFEAILNENGTVVFQYRDVETGSLVYNNGRCASIGVENRDGTAGVNYLFSFPPMSTATNDLQNRLTPGRAIKLYREFRDAAALDIIQPATYVFPETILPVIKVQNYGTVGDTIMAFLRISPGGYLDSILITGLLPGRDTTVTLATPWFGRGTFTAICSTAMTGDVNPGNDVFSRVFVSSPWVQRADIPVGPARRRVKDASLVYAPTTGRLYALKGGNSNEFYAYDIATGTWESLPSMPLDPSGKKARDGCDLTFNRFQGTAGTIYAIKGGGTADFYAYDIATGTWTPKRSLSVRNFNFRLPKRGAALAYVPTRGPQGTVYCAPGNNSLTFIAYDVAADTWSRCPDVPFNPLRKRTCRYGTDMVYDGDSIIYLLKGSNTTEVWKYYPQFDTWAMTTLDQVSMIGNRNRRVKNGGAIAWLNGSLFVLKGGNTQEFWSYRIGGPDTWSRRSDLPVALTGKRVRPKRGAAMAGTDSAVFCLKGSSVYEFWEYRPHTDSLGNALFASAPDRQGVQSRNTALPAKLNLAVYPTPATAERLRIAFNLPHNARLQLRIYDATGALIRTLADGSVPAGSYTVSWDGRTDQGKRAAPGIYFIKLETGSTRLTRKLILER
ncbi:MAG: FlgD immunoglobulin-like domain containing protein [candidate division WOR-3 bacterium]